VAQERYRQAKETKRGGKGGRESERLVVPVKRGNPPRGDPVEGRGRRDAEPLEGKMMETPDSAIVSTKLRRIATLAREMPGVPLNTLAHHIDMDWMREAFRRTRKDGAVGVDGQTAREYEADLEVNLRSLMDRAKSGRYRAPAVRRVHIPKGKGRETRPIGIPTFEDKVLQRAVVMVLEAVYEQEFLDCSYGFRPGRSAHSALDALWHELMDVSGGWVLEIDIRNFFDSLDHAHLRTFLRRRVRDGVLLRLIGKWLNAGVLESGNVSYPESGTPQGGVISPLLANVFLHEVVDVWFEHTVKPRLKGRARLIRYADDMLMVFAREDDARRVLAVLPKRFEKHGLTLHPEKTRLVKFNRPRSNDRQGGPSGPRAGTFDLLGFTHYWGRTRRGGWAVKRKTAADRFGRALRAVARWCRTYRHLTVREQWQALCRKLKGHFGYYGITGNSKALDDFRYRVKRVWRAWLSRRSQTAFIAWDRFALLEQRYPLPPVRLARPLRVT
jgi:group II intron reverse transcriptase/maturase